MLALQSQASAATGFPVAALVAHASEDTALPRPPVGALAFSVGALALLVLAFVLMRSRSRARAAGPHGPAPREPGFQPVLDAAPIAMLVVDREGRIRLSNQLAEKLFGYGSSELIGLSVETLIPDRFRDQHAAQVAGYFQGPEARAMGAGRDLYGRRKDGSEVPIEIGLNPIFSAGADISVFTSIIDISDRKKMEGQLRQAAKMEVVGHLAGGIAHDFNNLLTVLLGRTQLLLRQVSAEHSARGDIELIHGVGERAAALTRQLLSFSRQQSLETRVIEVNDAIRRIETLLQRVVRESVNFECVLRDDVGYIRIDPGQLEQIIMNLVVNAQDAVPDGGSILIETQAVRFDESYARTHAGTKPGEHVLIAVTDTGCGMDEQTLARVFDPFFTTKGASRGTGLGLAMVYGIVHQHGGRIWVYSEPGKGSTFKIYFPRLSEAGERVVRPPARAPRVARNEATILLVEDEPLIRDLVQEVLAETGYTVLCAEDGMNALERHALAKDVIDLTITDVIMPNLNGPELVARLLERHPEMKVLFMSGYTDGSIDRIATLGVQPRFIQKPFMPDDLLSVVQQVLAEPAP